MTMRRTLSIALLLLVCLVSPFARAQQDAAVNEAKQRFNEGVALADAGKHEEARLKFQQAAAVLKAAAVLYNLARSEQLTGHDFEAIEHYRQFLRVGVNDPTIKDEQRKSAQNYIAELTPKVGQVDIEAPPSSRISIDGKALDESPKEPVAVQPGKHTIEAAFEGKLKSVSVECHAGRIVKAKIEFESGGTTEPPGAGGSTSAWSTGKIVTVAGLGAGAVAGVVVYFVFHGKAQNNVDEAQNTLKGGSCVGVTNNAACDHAASLKSDRDSNVTISTIGLVAGAVLAAGAVGTVLLWPSSKKESATTFTPTIAPGVAGASLSGRF
jgi:hypothetical protein